MQIVQRFAPWFAEAGEGRWLLRMEQFIEGLHVLRRSGRMAVAIGISMAVWSLSAVGAWVVLLVFSDGAPLAAAAVAIGFAVIGGIVIAVPAGVGIAHAALVYGVSLYAVSGEAALAFALVYHGLATLITACFGLVSLPGTLSLKDMLKVDAGSQIRS